MTFFSLFHRTFSTFSKNAAITTHASGKHLQSCNIIEVGLRDGLQNEKRILSLDQKYQYLQHMVKVGLRHIEIGSFVSPKWVPQMASTKELIRRIEPEVRSQLFLSALVPNMKGLEQAIESKVDEIVLFVSTTNTFNKANINCTQNEAFERFKDIAQVAKSHGIKVRGSLSCCFECPYEGLVNIRSVLEACDKYRQLNIDTIDIADTIGSATPIATSFVLDQVIQHVFPVEKVSLHFHDTNNHAIDNIQVGLGKGVTSLQSSLGGAGGCPYSSKRVGNLNTVKLIEYLQHQHIDFMTKFDLQAAKDAEVWIKSSLNE